jgi:1,2-diacylglycerol 3-beta-glucosyltransferase
VHERVDAGKRGKGYALRWGFDRLLAGEKGYDAFVVIDADTTVSKNLLQVMNHRIGAGASVIQCNDQVEPQPGAWSAESTRLGFTLYNYARPLGRLVLGLSAGLRGNGMCFTAGTLRRLPWDAYSLNEDLQYGLNLLLNGVTVVFAPEATVLATMPSDAAHAETQRARWEQGRFSIIRTYTPRLLWSAAKNRSFKPLDAAIDLLTPPLVNLMGVSFVLLCVNLVLWEAGITRTGSLSLGWLLVLLLGFVHVFAGLRAAGADRKLFGALAHVPRYALWKFMLYARLSRRARPGEWVRTFRER